MRSRLVGFLAVGLSLVGASGPLVTDASASGNASSAAAFIENAQNKDGGFGAERGQASNPAASLWATVALLAAGKNPQDEQLNGGSSADDYLASHLTAYSRSLEYLGLLAIVQSASGVSPAHYGDPGAALVHDLAPGAIHSDPTAAALGILGLLAINSGSSRTAATSSARTLLADQNSDGGWGSGGSTSASTATVLQALAESGVAGAGGATIKDGIAYLHKAQLNDGSIGTTDQVDPSSTGNVEATSFTIQAFHALHLPQLRTPTGTTVIAGLINYQQQGTGGLSPYGSYDTTDPPSVVDTAQAYPAFDGVTFPLPYVPYTSPQPAKQSASTPTTPSSAVNRVSVGKTSAGISSSTAGAKRTVGADRGATAAGSVKSRAGRGGATPRGTSVTGSVVGATPAPKLATRLGRNPGTDYTPLILAGILVAFALLGGVLDARRPRSDTRSPAAVAVAATASFLAAARARGAVAPFTALLVGALLVAIPFETHMWSRAPKGAAMIEAFAPYMQAHRIDGLQQDVALLDAGVREADAKGPALQFPSAGNAAAARRQFAAGDPDLALFSRQWPTIHRRFLSLLDPIQANRGNYRAIAALPSFSVFPWLFAVPGTMLIVLAAAGLLIPRAWTKLRWGILALGVGLLLAPVVFQMLDRAPKGARLVSAFQTVETKATVTALQDEFGSLAIGQGSLQTELLPALSRRGLGKTRIDKELPAVIALDNHWVAILGDLTPMLGVMSDNVANYQAVAALPDFTLFPWLFVIPGLLAAGLVLLGGTRGQSARRHRLQPAEPQAT
jgi:hypothetical protein